MNDRPVWQPDPYMAACSHMQAFRRRIERLRGRAFDNYAQFHHWSVAMRDQFWSEIWRYCEVLGRPGSTPLIEPDGMLSAQWFPDAHLNFAQNLLRRRGEETALVFQAEDHVRLSLSFDELYQHVAQCAVAMRAAGVTEGDRVVAYMSNVLEAVVVALAAASMGAIFSRLSSFLDPEEVLAKLTQITPALVFVGDGFVHDGCFLSCSKRLAFLADHLPAARWVNVPYPVSHPVAEGALESSPGVYSWQGFLALSEPVSEIDFAALPFSFPLYISFPARSSAASLPVVHGAGGVLLEHLKEHQLHCDIHQGDRVLLDNEADSSMWYWTLSALASGASILLYDGQRCGKEHSPLLEYAERESCSHLLLNALYIKNVIRKESFGVHDNVLKALKSVILYGGVLFAGAYETITQSIKSGVMCMSLQCNRDTLSCLGLGHPALPAWAGEYQVKGLGMGVSILNDAHQFNKEDEGFLVCAESFPSMPVMLWNDVDGSVYRKTYFSRFAGRWCHGEWARETRHGGIAPSAWLSLSQDESGRYDWSDVGLALLGSVSDSVETLLIFQDLVDEKRIFVCLGLRAHAQLDCALKQLLTDRIRKNVGMRHLSVFFIEIDHALKISAVPRPA